MHEIQAKSILTASNGMNIYRGCTHGCIYCDARSTCYQMKHKFEDIQVKVNAPELLEQSLRKKRKKCMIGTGGMSDPYIQLEDKLQITRRCLEVIERYGFGLAIQTKSDLILRDLDLLKSINEKSKCVVQMTLTTHDDDLCRLIEPNVCLTSRRVEVLNSLKDAGIPTVVWLTPILPFINDTKDNIRRLMISCGEAGVYGVLSFGIGLTLRDGDREYYYKQLEKHFPGLKERYISNFGNAYGISPPNRKQLHMILVKACNYYGMAYEDDKIFEYMNQFEDKQSGEQLSLF